MDNIVIKKNRLLKCGPAIKTLSIISLICTTLYFISCFFHCSYLNYRLAFDFPFSTEFILFLSAVTPAILFVLYIFKFYAKLKATILVPFIWGLLSLESLAVLSYDFYFGGYFNLLFFAACILALISSLKGFSKKALIKIAMSAYLLYVVLSLICTVSFMDSYIGGDTYLLLSLLLPTLINIIGSSALYIGSNALYIALFLFCLKNKIPSVLSPYSKKRKAGAEKMDPEQELKLLKDKLDLDMISEEEYQAQRAEIISKL